MGRNSRKRKTKTKPKIKKKPKLVWKRVAILVPLVAALTIYPIGKLKSPDKPPKQEQTKATMEQKRANKKLAKKIAWVGYGWKGKEWVCLDRIFYKEAKYDHLAKNQSGSSAYGIGQRLKETSKDPMVQILHTYKYIQHRYKNPCSAWRFHTRNNYY